MTCVMAFGTRVMLGVMHTLASEAPMPWMANREVRSQGQ